MTITWGPTTYPLSIDSYTLLTDHVDEVEASHPNSLLGSVIEIQTKLGIDGNPVTGLGAVAFTAAGLASNPSGDTIPTIWINTSHEILYSYGGVDYSVATSIDGLSDASTAGTENVFLGTDAGPLGDYNTGVGYGALDAVTAAGTYNNALGNYALGGVTAGGSNIGIGANAGLTIALGSNNIAIGEDSVNGGLTTGGFSYNIAIGLDSMGGGGTKSSTDNIGLGRSSLSLLTGGSGNTALGFDCLSAVTTGHYNIAIGRSAGADIVDGSNNIAIGTDAVNGGPTSATFSTNIAIGVDSMGGVGTKSGYRNIGVGAGTLSLLTTGLNNTAIGYQAGSTLTTGRTNTLIGSGAGGTVATNIVDANVCIGANAGDNLSLISNQLWIANSATLTPLIYGVFPNTSLTFTASDVILTGALTVPVYTPGTTTDKLYNIGHALYFNGAAVGGGGATDINGLSDGSTSGGTQDVYLGTDAGPLGDYNTGVGYGALDVVNATGNSNSAFGNYSLSGVTTGDYNVGVGAYAAEGVTTGSGNIGMGRRSLRLLTTGNYNVGIGHSAGYSIVDGSNNVVVGYGAVYGGNTTSTFADNVAVGTNSMAGVGTKTGSYNVGVGTNSIRDLGTGTYNVGTGVNSLYSVAAGSYNVAVGGNAGRSIAGGDNNIALGKESIYGALASTTAAFSDNIAIGTSSMGGAGAKSGTDNIGIGQSTLSLITAGINNTCIGSGAAGAYAANVVSSNVCIGYDAGNNLSLISNQLWIANSNTATPLVYGVFPNTSLTFTASDVILTGALTVPVYTPGTTTNKLYNIGGVLYFNGSATGGSDVYAENLDIDTGVIETVDSFDPAGDGTIIWHYQISDDATNMRCGTVMAVWDDSAGTVSYAEASTADIGDTSDVVLSVDMSGAAGTVRLRGLPTGSSDWKVRVSRFSKFEV